MTDISKYITSDGEGIAGPVLTTSQTQATPASDDQYTNVDYAAVSPTSGGVGAGTSPNSYDTRGNDNNPPISSNTTQQTLGQTFGGQRITPQPNVLDQYASYTYCISWYLLTPEQFNAMSTPNFNAGTWSLLIQSGGIPIAKRNQFFPDDYYLDDLEIETVLMGKGAGMSTNGIEMRFKVVEPNGITLIQNLYRALTAAYGRATVAAAGATQGATVNANQTAQIPNWGAAQYCLTIEFYGYDVNGNLVAPARGQYTTNGQLANLNSQAVIKKYYPFCIQNLTFRTVANAIEYNIVASAIPYDTGASQSRGTIPFGFQLSGQTVAQILQGGAGSTGTVTADPGARQDSANLPSAPQADDAQTANLFNDGTGYAPGYDPNAGWST
jgi:hypothetical protein